MKPTVSFLLPHLGDTPRRRDGLEACIESIRALDYPSELIDIDIIDGPGTVPEKIAEGVWDTEGEYIVYAANDMTFDKDALKIAIRESIKNKKRLVSFNSGKLLPDGGNCNEHFLIKRDLIPEIGGAIFPLRYHHCGVDNILWAYALHLGEAMRCEEAIVHHDHFTQGAEFDGVYSKGWKNVEQDRETLRKDLKDPYEKGIIR